MKDTMSGHCLNCDRSESEVPLVSLRYKGNSLWICPQCLPVLIHHPEQLVGKLRGMSTVSGAPEDREG